MPITSIFDLIPHCPNPAPVNVVPMYDGCNRVLTQIVTGATCEETLACFTANPNFIGTLLVSTNGSLNISGNNIEVNTDWINANIIATLGGINGCTLTVGSSVLDLCSIFSNINYTFADAGGVMMDVGNGDTINLLGIDGMRFFITPANTISVGLPALRQHMQVLTRDDVNHVAYWENNQCCAQTLSFDTTTNILSISGTNSVDLTSINTDNQELVLNGNILSITQLNSANQSVDLSAINRHTLNFVDATNMLSILGVDGNVNDTISLANVNEHTLSYDGVAAPNTLNLLGSDGLINSSINLNQVNEHTLVLVGSTATWDTTGVHIELYGSDGVLNSTVQIPRPAIASCADVNDCPDIIQMKADIAANLAILHQIQADILLIQNMLP